MPYYSWLAIICYHGSLSIVVATSYDAHAGSPPDVRKHLSSILLRGTFDVGKCGMRE